MATLAQFKDKVYRKGVQKGLNLAADYMEDVAVLLTQMAKARGEAQDVQASDRLSDKADLLRGHSKLVRTIQFKDVRPQNDRRKEPDEKADPAQGTSRTPV